MADVGAEMRQDGDDRFTNEKATEYEEQIHGVEGNVKTSYDQNVDESDDSSHADMGPAAGT